MKQFLLFITLLTTFQGFSQKRISSRAYYELDINGDTLVIDSSLYTYSQQQLGLPHFGPQLTFNEYFHIFGISLSDPIQYTEPDQITSYGGTTHPLSYSHTVYNTITNGYVTEYGAGGSWRARKVYDQQGNLITYITETENSGIWTPTDSTSYTYDSNNNQLTEAVYEVSTLDVLIYTDSSTYLSGTNLLTSHIRYLPYTFGGALEPLEQTIITYNGQEIDYEDHYFNVANNGTLEWNQRAVFEYLGGKPINYHIYNVVNNVLLTTPSEKVVFNYNAQGYLENQMNMTMAGDTTQMNAYEYDADNFVSKETIYHLNFAAELYVSNVYYYYYEQGEVGVSMLIDENVSIYPIPADNVIHIDTKDNLKHVHLLNLSGQTLLEQHHSIIDLNQISSGVYIVQGQTDKGFFSKKIIKR